MIIKFVRFSVHSPRLETLRQAIRVSSVDLDPLESLG